MISDHFQRYKPLIDDWDAFLEAVQRPLPTTIWANPLKTMPDQLQTMLAQHGIQLQPLAWYPGAFHFPADVQPGLRWEYLAGLYHVQEEVALLPITLLDLQPTDRVLDMCAAPGNKTAQMSVLMQNQGTIIANDRNGGRMRAARQTFNRLGILNVTMLTQDASNLPRHIGQFDKILADVPCTCEGTCRKEPSILDRASVADNRKLARIQKAILRKAVQRCRPGGRIVYATCTFAPEENELVVDEILQEYSQFVRLRPIALPGFKYSVGITEWHGRHLHPSLQHTVRVWPHQNDTGGFYIALLEKIGSETAEDKPDTVANLYADILEPQPWIEKVCGRFGMETAVFDAYTILRWSNRGVWLINKEHQPVTTPQPDSIGMMFMRTQGRYPKLTTSASRLLGQHANKNMIDLNVEQTVAYINRQEFVMLPEQTHLCTGTGYVLLRYRERPLGIGVYREHKNRVESMFPKGWVRQNVQL
ncbi:MAG: methyltransferase domain-containing protein [Chloroflexi bacterium]|nr:methyltransferase domain-containing protein [Chloroflexota bacterium]